MKKDEELLCINSDTKINDRQTFGKKVLLFDGEKSLYEEQRGSEHCPMMQ